MNAGFVAQALQVPLADDTAAAREFSRVGTDSRTVLHDELFVALHGARFDGNDFIDSALERGAAGIICDRGRALARPGVVFFQVPDTLRALGELARAHRRCFDLPVVAITGSNGKTTTKNLLRSILVAAHGAQSSVLATEGNLNNLIGMPLTLLGLAAGHRVAILEMGMSAFGEIARMTEIAEPTHGLITCVAPAHLEGLGSLDGVAKAKGELFRGLSPQSVAVVNHDDERVLAQAALSRCRRIDFGCGTDVCVRNVEPLDLAGMRFELAIARRTAVVTLPLLGRHNVDNALAAAACAVALGVELRVIASGLEAAAPAPMRLALERLPNGVNLINDAYNANPSSMRAALEALRHLGDRSLIALGEMRELGDAAARLHEEVGAAVAAVGPRIFCAVGAGATAYLSGALGAGLPPDRAIAADTHAEAAAAIARAWREDDTVLVKGSRGARMEDVVEALRRRAQT